MTFAAKMLQILHVKDGIYFPHEDLGSGLDLGQVKCICHNN